MQSSLQVQLSLWQHGFCIYNFLKYSCLCQWLFIYKTFLENIEGDKSAVQFFSTLDVFFNFLKTIIMFPVLVPFFVNIVFFPEYLSIVDLVRSPDEGFMRNRSLRRILAKCFVLFFYPNSKKGRVLAYILLRHQKKLWDIKKNSLNYLELYASSNLLVISINLLSGIKNTNVSSEKRSRQDLKLKTASLRRCRLD